MRSSPGTRRLHAATAALVLLCITFSVQGVAQETRFAVIGDYGFAGQPEADVASLVQSWNPAFILTVGDNNYEYGEAATIDANIGQYYHAFLSPYAGAYGAGDTVNRFFPALGNHDWIAAGAAPYLGYFTLPGNERYYDFVRGPVHLFCLDADPHEVDGIDSASVQAQWLKAQLASATERWKIVYLHQSPYSSGSRHGSYPILQWPFERWGASAVLSGHDHTYERIMPGGIPYFVDGLGGRSIYTFTTPVPGSQFRYNGDYGAMLVDADRDSIVFSFIARSGTLIDRYPVYAADTAEVPVDAGWNLVSLPMNVGKRPAGMLFPGAVSKAFALFQGHYALADSLEAGIGYWLKFPVSGVVKITGDTLTTDTVHVVKGWNMIGTLTLPAAVATILESSPGLILTPFYEYGGSYAAADTLRPGKGYWVRAADDGTLFLAVPPLPPRASK